MVKIKLHRFSNNSLFIYLMTCIMSNFMLRYKNDDSIYISSTIAGINFLHLISLLMSKVDKSDNTNNNKQDNNNFYYSDLPINMPPLINIPSPIRLETTPNINIPPDLDNCININNGEAQPIEI